MEKIRKNSKYLFSTTDVVLLLTNIVVSTCQTVLANTCPHVLTRTSDLLLEQGRAGEIEK